MFERIWPFCGVDKLKGLISLAFWLICIIAVKISEPNHKNQQFFKNVVNSFSPFVKLQIYGTEELHPSMHAPGQHNSNPRNSLHVGGHLSYYWKMNAVTNVFEILLEKHTLKISVRMQNVENDQSLVFRTLSYIITLQPF